MNPVVNLFGCSECPRRFPQVFKFGFENRRVPTRGLDVVLQIVPHQFELSRRERLPVYRMIQVGANRGRQFSRYVVFPIERESGSGLLGIYSILGM